ncbi:MAG: hypothetical protein K9M98_03740 [Cephaloticoccus sp.]|nr:hypothetical protein [Cephaloticoccus sp.]MCF7759594.1 hypothetical protein [Cephaloticoccus sp.]
MTPGPRFDVAFDWSYWLWIRTDPAPIDLQVGGSLNYPTHLDTPAGLRQAEFNNQFITLAEAPTVIDFATAPDFSEFQGGFGLLDSAWTGSAKSGPVIFSISLIGPDGHGSVLLERRLDPANQPDDRGVRPFKVALPQPLAERLRLKIQSVNQSVPAQGFWTGLTASTINMSLPPKVRSHPTRAAARILGSTRQSRMGSRACLPMRTPPWSAASQRSVWPHSWGLH